MVDKGLRAFYLACMLCSSEFHKDFFDFRILTTEISVSGLLISRIIEATGITALDDWQFDSTEVDMNEDNESVVGYFSDKCIDLGIILRDQIFLDLPDYPQCGPVNGDTKASCSKILPLEGDQIRDNPFVKL